MDCCRILIVEGDSVDRARLKSSLLDHDRTGFEFAEESAGRSVLARCEEFRPHCVLLDLNLPDVNGLDLLAGICRGPEAPAVVALTAGGSEQIAVRAMKSGATDYVVKNGLTPELLVHTVENAIEKHTLRAGLERQRDRYRLLTEAIPQVVWTATHPEGAFDYISHRWRDATGLPADAALGAGWLNAVHGSERGRVERAWREALRNCSLFEIDCRLGKPEHGYRWHLARAVPQVENDSVIRWFGTFTDIEERRRAEEALQRRQKQEGSGALAGSVARDFNSLLAGILSGINCALQALPASHEARPSLRDAMQAGERAAMLTRQMLAYAGKGTSVVEPVDLPKLVRSTCNLVRASIPKLVRLAVETALDTPPLEADASQLQQLVMNLVVNAAEAIGDDIPGIVTLRTGMEVLDRSDPLEGIDAGCYAFLEVSDTGCGMTEDVQDRIFDPLFTTKFAGRGLGLAAVMGIVRSAKGGIRVRSMPELGTTVRVLLPSKVTAKRGSWPELKPARPMSTGRVLVVDDEPIVLRMAVLALERQGFTVRGASGGEEALASFRDDPDSFDLVLMDMNMPGLSGEETLRLMRKIRPAVRVIVFTGYPEQEVASRLRGSPVAGILQKPVTSQTLVNRVVEFLSAAPTHA